MHCILNNYFSVLLACCYFGIVFTNPTINECLGNEFFPIDGDCARFYMCLNGSRYDFNCPAGFYFDQSISSCNWIELVKCNGMPQQQTPTIEDHTSSNIIASNDSNRCNRNGFFPNLHHCGRFYICSNGILLEFECAPGLHFDVTINKCNLPSLVNCNDDVLTTKPPTMDSSTTSPGNNEDGSSDVNTTIDGTDSESQRIPTTQQDDGNQPGEAATTESATIPALTDSDTNPNDDPSKSSTAPNDDSNELHQSTITPNVNGETMPSGTESSSESFNHTTVKPTTTTATATTQRAPPQMDKERCQVNGYFAERNNCNRFYVCHNGLRYDFQCPSGLYFDEALSTCNRPSALITCI